MKLKIFWPVLGPINAETEKSFEEKINLISGKDSLISYLSSHGGEANVTSRIIEKLSVLSVDTIVYAGSMAYSSGSIIYSAFKKRLAFRDSKFLIHECIPPKGMERTEIFEEYDRQIWHFMSERLKISFSDLSTIAKKGERFSVKDALEIGLVQEIIDASWRDFKDLVIL
jgi:ATP-dependent protease ClpP protease subunit